MMTQCHYDSLETRRLLSAAWAAMPSWFHPHSTAPLSSITYRADGRPMATVTIPSTATARPGSLFATPTVDPLLGPATAPFTPAQIRHFYGVDQIALGPVAGDGSGQTIAVIDAYNNPKFVDSTSPSFSTSDLAVFDQRFGLPDPPSFKRIAEDGSTNLPTGYNSTWALETALDVEWAHAVAPAAGILLVEASSSSLSDLLATAAVTAKNYPGVVAVSMSFGQPEYTGIDAYSNYFVSARNHPVTFVASTGDQGSEQTDYPAFAVNVVAVGGTTITTSDANASYGSEVVWSDNQGATGGGISTEATQPYYQANTATGSTYRTVPDVSFLASPTTGVYVRDSSQSSGQWFKVGGTSLSAPCWAGLIAVADQGRSRLGLSTLDGGSDVLSRLYNLPSSDFNDITSGYNGFGGASGYYATPGYDLASGLGTPKAPTLVPDLAGGATVAGRVYADYDADGTFDHSDAPIPGQQIYLDLNNNGVYDANDLLTRTDSNGLYSFPDIAGHQTGTVRLLNDLVGGAYDYVADPGTKALATSYGATDTIDFGFFPTRFSTASTYTLQLSADHTAVQILADGSPIQSSPVGVASTFTFNSAALVVDGANGNPVPAAGITFNGSTLSVIGSVDPITVTASAVQFGSVPINDLNATSVYITPATGSALTIQSGSATIPATAVGIRLLSLASLTVAANGHLTVAAPADHADRSLLSVGALTGTGTIDLTTNDFVLRGGGAVTTLTSSAADALHALGNAPGSTLSTFDGYTPAPADVLVKYTFRGDANLDGKVDGSDYARIDNGYLTGATGWANGDFNADGVIDGSDYTLIDNAFNAQSSNL